MHTTRRRVHYARISHLKYITRINFNIMNIQCNQPTERRRRKFDLHKF